MSEFQYNDILNMQYPNPEIEKDFPDKILRGAQFAPFAALTGHDEAVKETARLTERFAELDEYEREELNRRLVYLKKHMTEKPTVTITFFVPDGKKEGGAYQTLIGRIKKLLPFEGLIVTEDDREIPVEEIVSIESELFDD